MAKAILHPWIEGIQGRLGGLVFRRSSNGETIVSKTPDMTAVVWSPAQQDHRQRFKAAIAYANAAMADPGARTVYEKRAAAGNRRPFQRAVSDYFNGVELLSGK